MNSQRHKGINLKEKREKLKIKLQRAYYPNTFKSECQSVENNSPVQQLLKSSRSSDNKRFTAETFRCNSVDFRTGFLGESPQTLTQRKSLALSNWKQQFEIFQKTEREKFNITPLKQKSQKLMSEHAFQNNEYYRDIVKATNTKSQLSVNKYFNPFQEQQDQQVAQTTQSVNKKLKNKDKQFKHWQQLHSTEHNL